MIILEWKGKAIGENRRLCQGKTRWFLNPAYRAFKETMVAVFAKSRPEEPYVYADAMVTYDIGPRSDHHGFQKPIMDAMQEAGIIDNDKHFGWVRHAPPTRHKQGELDTITIILTGEK